MDWYGPCLCNNQEAIIFGAVGDSSMNRNLNTTWLVKIAAAVFLATAAPVWAQDSAEDIYADVLQERAEYACLSSKEADLFRLINEYRESQGLPPIAGSRSLTKVARVHAVDLQKNKPFTFEQTDDRCTLHSWSDTGSWTPVCYTSDHRFAEQMWSKPKEITNYEYPGDGYENAYWTSDAEVTPQRVLEAWKKSPSHNALLLESGIWKGSNLLSFGVGVQQNVAVMWVGTLVDPVGSLPVCSNT